jgi:hypothetical protein
MLLVDWISQLNYMTDQPNRHGQTSPKGNKRDRWDGHRPAEIVYGMLATATGHVRRVRGRGYAEMACAADNQNTRCALLNLPSTRDIVYPDKHITRQFPSPTFFNGEPPRYCMFRLKFVTAVTSLSKMRPFILRFGTRNNT